MSDRPDWARDGAAWPNRSSSQFVTSGGMVWHVQLSGTGPVVLLLHGTGAATHSWRALLPLLSRHFTVVAPDLPRHGFTARGPQTLPGIARALEGLLATLELRPDIIVGHSAGAAIAIRMALDGRVAPSAFPAAVVGLNPALLPFPGLAAKLFPTLAKLLFVNPFAPHLFARMARVPGETGRFMARSTGSTIDADGVADYARLFARPGHVAGTIGMMANWDLEGLRRELPALSVPLLVVHGDRDAAIPIATARDATDMVPGAIFESIAGLGHLAHEEQPALIADRITVFARQHMSIAAAA